MKFKRTILGLLEGAVWYFLVCYAILTIKKPDRNLLIASAILLVLFVWASFSARGSRHTPTWRNL